MHALLIGATGATGRDLLALLLNDESFSEVSIFVRREPQLRHEKLRVQVIDFEKPEQWRDLVKGDVLFSCLGTTLKAAGGQDAQWKIDYDYQYGFAQAARKNGVPCCVLVSAAGASPNSRIFYSRMKGKLEVSVKELGFPRLVIFRPPLLVRKGTDRPMEVFAAKAIGLLNKLGLLKGQRPMPTEVLARAMISSGKSKSEGISLLEGKSIWRCARLEP